MNRFVRMLLLAAALAASASMAWAQFPAKTVRVVVPYPPGGGNDTLARPIAQKLGEKWGQTVVVDNRGGATGMIGTDSVAKAPPDGYSVLLSSSPEIVMNLSLFPKMAYDPVNDLVPVTLVAVTPLVLAVHPSLAVRTVEEYLALARASPGRVAYSSSGNGGPHHVAGALLGLLSKTSLLHVPYKGGGPQLADLLAGHTPSAFLAMPVAAPHIRSGKIRAIAVTTAMRSTAFPSLPTLAESGVPGYESTIWFGLLAPAGTPQPIVNRLSQEIGKVLNQKAMRDRFNTVDLTPTTPEGFAAHIQREIPKWRKVVTEAKITAL